MLGCFKALILIDIVNHPTELVNIFALISSVVCNYVEMFVLWLRRHNLGVLSIIIVPDSERGKNMLVKLQKCLNVSNPIVNIEYLTKSKQCVICSFDLFKSSEMQ